MFLIDYMTAKEEAKKWEITPSGTGALRTVQNIGCYSV